MTVVCFLIALTASIIGAITGVGGGVIMKPVLDAVTDYSVSTIGLISGSTVLVMAVVTIIRRSKETKMDFKIAGGVSIGAVTGGILGKSLFDMVKAQAGENTVGAVQSLALMLLTLLTLIVVLNLKRIRTYRVKSPIAHVCIGFALGIISSFLGIGGGPINIMALLYFFSMDNKEAAGYSLCIIALSQSAALIMTLVGGLPPFSPLTLALSCVGGVAGGIIGSKLVAGFSKTQAAQFFACVLGLIVVICAYNFYTAVA